MSAAACFAFSNSTCLTTEKFTTTDALFSAKNLNRKLSSVPLVLNRTFADAIKAMLALGAMVGAYAKNPFITSLSKSQLSCFAQVFISSSTLPLFQGGFPITISNLLLKNVFTFSIGFALNSLLSRMNVFACKRNSD